LLVRRTLFHYTLKIGLIVVDIGRAFYLYKIGLKFD
jgi:hypothetical protein